MLRLLSLAVLASYFVACNGDVVENVDNGGGGAGGSGGSAGSLSCGDTPTVGKIITACEPMDGDYCVPATWFGLLESLAKANGVCAATSSAACCDKPAYRQVVCDQPPGTNDCCYDVHFIEKVVCP